MLLLQSYCKIYQEVLSSSNAYKHTGVLAHENSPPLAKGRKCLTVRNAVPLTEICAQNLKNDHQTPSMQNIYAGQNNNQPNNNSDDARFLITSPIQKQ